MPPKNPIPSELTLDSLTPDPHNARRHDDRNLQVIADSLRDVGAARSIVVDENGTILAGNATVIAVRRSGLTEEQKQRLALYDNRASELAEWDTDILAGIAETMDLTTLWEPVELSELLGVAPDIEFPEFDESAAEEVAHVTCPECGATFPR
jgi:hypothetical protein